MPTKKSTTRRGGGEGSWTKISNNKWKFTITIGRNPEGKQIRRSHTGTKRECQEWYKNLQASSCNDYFYDYAMKWLSLRESGLASGTVNTNKTAIKTISRIINFKIAKVNDFILKDIVDNLLKKCTTSTVAVYLSILRCILEYAFSKRHIEIMPFIPSIKQQKQNQQKQLLTIQEIKDILIYAKLKSPLFYFPILLLGFCTGMRIGEILALKKSDINLDQSTIAINKTACLSLEGKNIIKTGGKTSSSNRTIYVNKNILKTLLTINASSELIFTTKTGNPFYVSNVSFRISLFFKTQGITGYTAHSMRHNFITLAQENGVDWRFISSYVGHTLPSTTLSVYSHFKTNTFNKPLNNFIELFVCT